MTDIRISDVVAKTGFGARYWQRRVAAGEVPGARFVQAGARRIFVLDEAQFSAWWETQKCPVTSGGAVRVVGSHQFNVVTIDQVAVIDIDLASR